jgi:hypothetical protein
VFFLLPGAERNRKKLLTVLAVLSLCVQSCFPLSFVDDAVHAVLGPVMQPITRLAGAWSSLFQRLPRVDKKGDVYNSPLISAERRFGHPLDVPGVAWLEVPVLDIDEKSGQMKLAAGRNFHLSAGQIVAFADNYLGRISEVEDDIAYVDLFNRAGQRTGIKLSSSTTATRAVCFGRGLSGPAIVDWIEDEKVVEAQAILWWRPRPLDIVHLANAGLKLGKAVSEGSAEHGDYMFVVAHQIPASAEGRVYVAASAIGDSIVAEPIVHHHQAQRIMLGDAVFGNRLVAVSSGANFTPAVLSDHSRVCGQVLAWRGNWGWAHIQQPSSWVAKSVALYGGRVRLHDAGENQVIYTRGGAGVPRGMLLGDSDAPLFVPSANLDVWLAPQSKGVVHQ